jgi:hypothetical protein
LIIGGLTGLSDPILAPLTEVIMKPQVLVGVTSAIFVGCLGMAALRAQNGQGNDQGGSGGDDSRIQVGFKYAHDQGISLDLKGKNRALVGLGSYLVNGVGGCNDCHTQPPYTQDPYAFLGAPKQVNVACYLAGGQEFGPFVSRDITPWEDNKPAGLTLQQFVHVIRTGEDPDNPGQLLQVMPWPVYQTMTDRDLSAVYEYLSSIPPIRANTCGTPSE